MALQMVESPTFSDKTSSKLSSQAFDDTESILLNLGDKQEIGFVCKTRRFFCKLWEPEVFLLEPLHAKQSRMTLGGSDRLCWLPCINR